MDRAIGFGFVSPAARAVSSSRPEGRASALVGRLATCVSRFGLVVWFVEVEPAVVESAAGDNRVRRRRLAGWRWWMVRAYSGGCSGSGAVCTRSPGLRAGVAAMLALAARM